MTDENAITVLEKFVEINHRTEPAIVIEAVKTAIGRLKDFHRDRDIDLSFVIDALNRAEAKKPNVLDAYEKSYDLECPNCGAGNFHLMYDDNVADHFDFCAHCGQALDWSDVE